MRLCYNEFTRIAMLVISENIFDNKQNPNLLDILRIAMSYARENNCEVVI